MVLMYIDAVFTGFPFQHQGHMGAEVKCQWAKAQAEPGVGHLSFSCTATTLGPNCISAPLLCYLRCCTFH